MYDFVNQLFSSFKWNALSDQYRYYFFLQITELCSTHPTMPSKEVTIAIKFVKRSTISDCVHFYNVLFRRIMDTLGLLEMKRNFYDLRAIHELPQHR